MSLTTIDGDCRINGTLAANRFSPPSGSIGDAAIAAVAGIQATKVIHQTAYHYEQDPGSAVVTAARLLHTVYGQSATVVNIDVLTTTPPTGTDTVTVDVQKGNAATAFASILTSPVTITSSTAARAPIEAAIAATSLADDDTLQVVVTAAAGSGTQAQGLLVTLTLCEQPV